MSTAVVVLVAVGVLAVFVALYLKRRQSAQLREDQRQIAQEHRNEAERHAHSAQLAQVEADAHADRARELDPDLGDRQSDERQEEFGHEREGLHTAERPPDSEREPEPARRTA